MNTHDKIELPPLRIPDLEDELTAVLCAAISWGGSVISSEEYVAAKQRFRAAVNAAIEADRKQRFENGEALKRYKECGADEEQDPIERLRFFCSLAMSGQDWLDSKQFFEDLIADRKRRGEPVAWQPIETAPHGEEVLLGWLEWDGAWKMEVSQASWGWSTKTASNISRHGQATHWMPLPDAPQPADPSGASTLHNVGSGAQNGIQAPQPAEPGKEEILNAARHAGYSFVKGADGVVRMVPEIQGEAQGTQSGDPLYCKHPQCKTTGGCDGPCSSNHTTSREDEGRRHVSSTAVDDQFLPDEPVKVPSDSAIMFEWSQTPNTGDMRVDLIAFARALLARYGSTTGEATKQQREIEE